ncbi:hypothetical protein D3C80_1665790 [compost metagenome]
MPITAMNKDQQWRRLVGGREQIQTFGNAHAVVDVINPRRLRLGLGSQRRVLRHAGVKILYRVAGIVLHRAY